MTGWMMGILTYFRNQINGIIHSQDGNLGGLFSNEQLMGMLVNMVRIFTHSQRSKKLAIIVLQPSCAGCARCQRVRLIVVNLMTDIMQAIERSLQ